MLYPFLEYLKFKIWKALMITISSLSHDLSLSQRESAQITYTINEYSKHPIQNPIYRIHQSLKSFCHCSDWQRTEVLLQKRVFNKIKNVDRSKRITDLTLTYLLDISNSNSTTAGLSFNDLIDPEAHLTVEERSRMGGLDLHSENDQQSVTSDDFMSAHSEADDYQEPLRRRNAIEQKQMNYAFLHSPYADESCKKS
jgi:hypothetical protein